MNICSLYLQNIYKSLKDIVMPARDKTGPQGIGPMTGRRMGYCADNETNPGLFYGRGGRFGMGRRGMYNTEAGDITERSSLMGELSTLINQLSSLVNEIKGFKK